jgi:hypothetical protein
MAPGQEMQNDAGEKHEVYGAAAMAFSAILAG